MATKWQLLNKEHDELSAEGNKIVESQAQRTAEDQDRLDQITARLQVLNGEIKAENVAREAMRTAPAMSTSGHVSEMHDNASDRPWACMGEFLQAVAAAYSPNGMVDPRLYQAASGMSSGIPSDGGIMVGKDFSTVLLQRGMDESVLAPLCTHIEIGAGSDGLEAPYIDETSRANGSRWGGVRVYRRAEADTVTATKPKLGMFDLRLEDLMGIAYATERLLKDATALQGVMTTAFGSEFGFKLDDEIFRGSGAGECLGFTKSAALVTVAKENTQVAKTIMVENISNMWARLYVRSRGRAVWLHNQDVEPQLDQLALVLGVSALEPRVVSYGPEGVLRIKGRPVYAIEQAESVGTVGDLTLVDLSEYILIEKGGIIPAESIHVRFLYNERAFRWVYQVNGAPKWKAPLTPYKGTGNTVSPFVALATRA